MKSTWLGLDMIISGSTTKILVNDHYILLHCGLHHKNDHYDLHEGTSNLAVARVSIMCYSSHYEFCLNDFRSKTGLSKKISLGLTYLRWSLI